MVLPIGPIIGTLADNLRLRKTVMPMPRRRLTGWAEGLNIPRGGDTVLYTGHMYQMVPSIAAMESKMARFGGNKYAPKAVRIGRVLNRFINALPFVVRPEAEAQKRANDRLRNIARLLQAAGIEFGYLYEEEQYAGALVCDLGMEAVFQQHARQLYALLKKHGVRRVITVDPHTMDMLANVYPRFIDGYDLEVSSYLDVLAKSPVAAKRALNKELVIHDSCIYARHLGIVDPPRELLERSGARLRCPENAAKTTQCCGGPAESLYPEKARAFAEKRIEQLKSADGKNIVTMCPLCLLNLQGVADDSLSIRDISEHLVEAFCDQ